MKRLNTWIAGCQEDNGAQSTLERREQTFCNARVRLHGDEQRLFDIQTHLNMTAFRKTQHPIAEEFKDLDLTSHTLLYEGTMKWRNNTRKEEFINMHILLLEDFIILLHKKNNKFILKFYNHCATDSLVPPIIHFSEGLVRPNVLDSNAFYLVSRANIYDFVAASREECKIWFHRLSKAVQDCKKRKCAISMDQTVLASTSRDVSCESSSGHLNAEHQRKWEIQKLLNMSSFEKTEHPIAKEFKALDLTKHRLLFEGSLKWLVDTSKKELIDVHVLLLEDFIIILQKNIDKFNLMFFQSPCATDHLISPILRVPEVLVRASAADTKSFYIVDFSNVPCIHNFIAATREESRLWIQHISDAVKNCKGRMRTGEGRENIIANKIMNLDLA